MARSVLDFTELVTDHLIPIIRFVGHKDQLFDALERIYPGLVHEREYSGEGADLVIFDEMPVKLLHPQLMLPADTAYIFALSKLDVLPDADNSVLQNLNALTLVNTDPEQLLWNVKALLLMNELSYTNGLSTFVDLLSLNPVHRTAMSQLIDVVITRRSCIVEVPSEDYLDALIKFLFDSAPDSSTPVYVDISRAKSDLFDNERCNIIIAYSESDIHTISDVINEVEEYIPILLFTMSDCSMPHLPSRQMNSISLEDSLDMSGIHLVAYWCSSFASHWTGKVEFYTKEWVEEIFTRCENDPVHFRREILANKPQEEAPETPLEEILDTYQRLSLDSVLGELERRILLRMKERCPKIEAASHSVGIPTVTFHKRNARLAKKPNLLEMFSPSRDV